MQEIILDVSFETKCLDWVKSVTQAGG